MDAPQPITPVWLRKAFAEKGLGKYADALIERARPAVALHAVRVPEPGIPVGDSKFGGAPDLARGAEWPRHEGRALTFLAQIDLAAVSGVMGEGANPLPARGHVFFFYDREKEAWGFDPADRGAAVVVHAPAGVTLDRTQQDGEGAPACRLEMTGETTFPEFDALEVAAADREGVLGLFDALLRGRMGHRVLGYPTLIQNPMEEECQMASNGIYMGGGALPGWAHAYRSGIKDWMLLLQLDTDEAPGWEWGDSGMLYFWIRRQDLARGDFTGIWCILQCY